MKKLLAGILVFALSGSAVANDTYTDTKGVWLLARPPFLLRSWSHINPAETQYGGPMTPEQYEQAALAGKVNVSLTITVDDLDLDESGTLWITDRYGSDHELGLLQTMTFSDDLLPKWHDDAYAGHKTSTTFVLDPIWLNDGLPVTMRIGGNLADGAELETSTLSVTVTHTPAPGAILLGGIGVGLVGWLRRRKTL